MSFLFFSFFSFLFFQEIKCKRVYLPEVLLYQILIEIFLHLSNPVMFIVINNNKRGKATEKEQETAATYSLINVWKELRIQSREHK